MLRFLTFLGGLFALGLAAISVGANFWFGTLLTVGAERWVYGAVFALLDGLKTVLVPLAAAAFLAGARAKGVVAVLTFAVLTSLSFTAEIGLYAHTKAEVVGDAKAAHARYADAKAAKAKAEADLAAIGSVRPAGDIAADIGAAKRDRLYDRSRQCTEATATESRDLCARLDRLLGEQENVAEASRLRHALGTATVALSKLDAGAAFRSIDPQAEALARLVSPVAAVEAESVRTALAVLIALLIELGSGLGPWLASPNARKAEANEQGEKPEAEQPSPAGETPITADADGLAAMVQRFSGEMLVRRRGAFVPAAEVRAAFEAWCETQEVDPANATAFGKAMTAAGFEREKRGGAIRYLGIALAAPSRSPASALRVAVDNTSERRVLGHMAAGAGRTH